MHHMQKYTCKVFFDMYYTQLYPSARDSKMTDCTVEESKDYIQLCKNDIRMSMRTA